jgi:hypothetical protein
MSRPGHITRSRAITAFHHGEPSNVHDVEIILEPINTQRSRQAPQLATQASVPVNNNFSFVHASLRPNHNHQTPLQNHQT